MIILYTIHCPSCNILEQRLQVKNIKYQICDDTNIMQQKGMTMLPMLEVDRKLMGFGEAIRYLNNIK